MALFKGLALDHSRCKSMLSMKGVFIGSFHLSNYLLNWGYIYYVVVCTTHHAKPLVKGTLGKEKAAFLLFSGSPDQQRWPTKKLLLHQFYIRKWALTTARKALNEKNILMFKGALFAFALYVILCFLFVWYGVVLACSVCLGFLFIFVWGGGFQESPVKLSLAIRLTHNLIPSVRIHGKMKRYFYGHV